MSGFRPTSKAFLQIMWNGEEASIPCLFLFTDLKRYIFNCSEGTQRLFTQRQIKLRKLDTFFMTRYQWSHMGGLPGFGMTLRDLKNDGQNRIKMKQSVKGNADLKAGPSESITKSVEDTEMKVSSLEEIVARSASPVMNLDSDANIKKGEMNKKTEKTHKITIYAPPGMKDIMNATKHFLRFDDSGTNYEVSEKQEYVDDEISVYSVPIHSKMGKSKTDNRCFEDNFTKTVNYPHPYPPSLCYACHLKPLPGKFNVKKAKMLGVPAGPLYGMLHKGQTIELDNGTKVSPADVVGPEIPGPKFLIIDCPEVSYVENLTKDLTLGKYLLEEGGANLVLHLSPDEVYQDLVYCEWIKKFPSYTKHIYLNKLRKDSIVYDSQHCLQIMLNHIDPKFFPLTTEPMSKVPPDSLKNFVKINLRESLNNSPKLFDDNDVKSKIDHSELLKRVKKVMNVGDDELQLLEKFHGGLNGKRPYTGNNDPIPSKKGNFDLEGESIASNSIPDGTHYPKVISLGTGASLPSKYRNVSATLIFLSEDKVVLLDCGEGTYGQLLRHYGQNINDVLLKIKFIFISHMHADHHLGLIALITKLNKLQKLKENSVIVMAPHLLLQWLCSYARVSEALSFKFINCRDAYDGISIQDNIDVQSMKVDHPGHAHGVVLKFGDIKITYSGDTMPCQSLIEAGSNSTLLIHEATLEDDMVEDAKDRKHSTLTQALEVARKMNAEFVLLTHFSQRYPKLPIVTDEQLSSKIVYAFDHMEFNLNEISNFCKLVPVLNDLLAEAEADDI